MTGASATLDNGLEYRYRRLAAAILEQATKDAQQDSLEGAQARLWLASSEARDLLGVVDIKQSRVLAWLEELPPVTQPALV